MGSVLIRFRMAWIDFSLWLNAFATRAMGQPETTILAMEHSSSEFGHILGFVGRLYLSATTYTRLGVMPTSRQTSATLSPSLSSFLI